MDWKNLLSTKRLGVAGSAPPRIGRSEFESDVDRIVFSSAFRRLGKKTQVHPLAANDHVHTRLTHSLEVSRVGQALGKRLGKELLDLDKECSHPLPRDITPGDLGSVVQAACLAHDLGNPPFGHAGEEAMNHWFEQNQSSLPTHLDKDHKYDLQSIEGNAQGFRIITQLENHIFDGGLQLTHATLGAFQKYPWSSRRREKKFGAYISEEKILEGVLNHLQIKQTAKGIWVRHPLAYLVEAADDICYAIIDIEDAVEIGILPFDDACEVLLGALSAEQSESVRAVLKPKSHRVNFARMRGPIMEATISAAVRVFMKNYTKIMDGEFVGGLLDFPSTADREHKMIKEAKSLAYESIFNDPKKVEVEIGCYATFDTLLAEFCSAALNQAEVLADSHKEKRLYWKSGRVLRLLGDHAPSSENRNPDGWSDYQCLRRVVDFIGGMTDNYAVYIAKQMQGGGFSGGQRP